MENRSLKLFVFCSLMSIASVHNATELSSLQALPSPYNTLTELLPFNGHGWYVNGPWIEKLMKNNNVRTVVEVGSWLGASTRHIASLLPEGGMLYAVDTWAGSIEHLDPQWSGMLPTLYAQFLSNVVHSGWTHNIVPLKMTSQEAASVVTAYGDHFDLIYIDAAHDTESVLKDLVSYFPFVADHRGILCGDDWEWGTVRVAVLRFAEQHELTVYADHNFWFLAEEGQFGLRSFVHASNKVWQFPKK